MDLIDRKAVLEAIRPGMTVTQLEREVMAIPQVTLDEVMAERYRQHNEGRGDVKGRFGYWKREWQEERLKAVPDFRDEGWEDRSAIQGTNPGLAELIKERQEAIAEEATRQEALSHEEKQQIVDAWHRSPG